MDAILSIVLALSGVAPADRADAPVAAVLVVAEACGDWIDLALLLDGPCVETVLVGAWEDGPLVLVAAVHVAGEGQSACAWAGYYAFPSSIYAHSIVSVPFHADEME